MIIGIFSRLFIFKNQAIKPIVYLLRYFPIGKKCRYTDHSIHVESDSIDTKNIINLFCTFYKSSLKGYSFFGW